MQILTYIRQTDDTHEGFAAKVGLTRMGLYNIIKRRSRPSMKTIMRIEEVTNGKVSYKDLAK